jgi:DNA-binding response OmpR family regulator
MVPLLKDFLSHELGKNVEVVSRFSAWDTLYAATDNVFDLVILAHSYESKDLSSQDLIKKIKKLDQSIPIIQFSSQEDGTNKQTDACYPLPKSRQELRPIAHFFKDYKRYFKKS